jgi:hypothetical protein
LIVAFPVFLVLVLMGIQFALYYHASHVALAAAQEGARTLRVEPRFVGAAEGRANDYLHYMGRKALPDGAPHGHVDNAAGMAYMEVTGNVESILPGFTFKVHEQSQGPIEIFRGDS